MDNHLDFGAMGEEQAARHLEAKGYKIIERNWRFGHREIDIIASYKDVLVVAEVKTRSGTAWQQPFQAVTKQKQRHLVEATDAYIRKNNLHLEVRFDVISVVMDKKKTEIEHMENAFYPLLR